MRKLSTVSICCLIAIAVPAQAAAPPPLAPELAAFVQTDEHKAAVLAAVKKASEILHGLCPTYEFSLTGMVSVYRPIMVGPNGLPASGIWKEPVSAAGCGGTLQFNTLTVISPEKGVQVVPLAPGDGLADPVLMKDAMITVYPYVAAKKPGCRQVQLVKTKFDGYEGEPIANARNGPGSRKWQETWTIWACDELIDMPISFVPNDKGTQFMTTPIVAQPNNSP